MWCMLHASTVTSAPKFPATQQLRDALCHFNFILQIDHRPGTSSGFFAFLGCILCDFVYIFIFSFASVDVTFSAFLFIFQIEPKHPCYVRSPQLHFLVVLQSRSHLVCLFLCCVTSPMTASFLCRARESWSSGSSSWFESQVSWDC